MIVQLRIAKSSEPIACNSSGIRFVARINTEEHQRAVIDVVRAAVGVSESATIKSSVVHSAVAMQHTSPV